MLAKKLWSRKIDGTERDDTERETIGVRDLFPSGEWVSFTVDRWLSDERPSSYGDGTFRTLEIEKDGAKYAFNTGSKRPIRLLEEAEEVLGEPPAKIRMKRTVGKTSFDTVWEIEQVE